MARFVHGSYLIQQVSRRTSFWRASATIPFTIRSWQEELILCFPPIIRWHLKFDNAYESRTCRCMLRCWRGIRVSISNCAAVWTEDFRKAYAFSEIQIADRQSASDQKQTEAWTPCRANPHLIWCGFAVPKPYEVKEANELCLDFLNAID